MSKSKFRAYLDPKVEAVFQWLFPHWTKLLQRDLADCESVLDLGCGIQSMLTTCNVPYAVGVDLYDPYIEASKKKGIHNKYIKADIKELEMESKSFDAVILMAVLEHLTKEEAFALMEKMESWAKKKVIITTTNGYLFQDDYDGNLLQEHKSGWDVEDFTTRGYKVNGIFGWKPLRGYLGHPSFKPAFFWEVVASITQYFTYYSPKSAFIFYVRKEC